jgi:hypothetical protein
VYYLATQPRPVLRFNPHALPLNIYIPAAIVKRQSEDLFKSTCVDLLVFFEL